MPESTALKPDTINAHVANVYPALAMLAGMQLGVFTAIGDDTCTVEAIAAELDVSPTKLQPLLYALVSGGLLEVREGRFSNTAESAEFLIKGRPRYIGGMNSAYADMWSSTMHTAASIRSGQPQAKHDFSCMSESELRDFILGIDAGAGASARRLHKEFDMSRFAHVLDAGGGAGGLAVGLAKLCPELRATVAELANVAPIARERIGGTQYKERVDVVEVDLVGKAPSGSYDAVVLRSVLQVMSAADAANTVINCVQALRPGGELFAFGRMLDDSRLSPPDAVAVNVMFLNVYDNGQAYTESEYRGWFEATGLEKIERIPVAGGYSILRGIKPR